MSAYKEVPRLADRFGPDLILADEDDREEHYRIVTEIEVDGQPYAILQLHGDPEEDAYLFRVLPDGEAWTVEDVEDDDEWDRIAEVYCQMIQNQ